MANTYIKKVEERYERHESEDEDGKTTVNYYWETENTESRHANEVNFRGITFPYSKIQMPDDDYIKTIKGDKVWSWKSFERVKVRFKYYGVPTKHTGTIYTKLENNTISDNSKFYKDKTIEQALEKATSSRDNVIFWICWIIFTAGLVLGFYYLENRWLED